VEAIQEFQESTKRRAEGGGEGDPSCRLRTDTHHMQQHHQHNAPVRDGCAATGHEGQADRSAFDM
jgi:hypothetical protein